ncbi:response regulator receiver modulated diguanylate cyclase [Tepidicaulis marinus]|uniref:diguanylate cyclase n=1 Tax=Tepidicaulis marinus TaxID=1333998 RepID=A0A081BE84_9HYPH|nr:PleD family two-component system response regulator [Tepidicaulis marinus]GAK46352.1 response regulator receiver modulated diguanylate cyclase [Tepidicaulis marinus]
MTARVLIVDDVPANLKLLDAKLSAEYFEVLQAASGPEALEVAQKELPDIVLLDVMMPGMDGFEVCRRLRADAHTKHIPVIMVTALDQQSDRVQGLEAGADDFLTKPVNDVALFARVKSLVRLKMLMDELRMRESTGQRIGLVEPGEPEGPSCEIKGRVLLLDDREISCRRIAETLAEVHDVAVLGDPNRLLSVVQDNHYDLIVISLSLQEVDGLRLCSQLKSLDATRNIPVLALVEEGDMPRLVRALDIGVNDYLLRPLDRSELLARCKTQLRHKRYQDQLRQTVQESLEAAITDPLTGLYNRRYMTHHLGTLVAQHNETGKPVSLLVLDIDYFKPVNDTHGHAVGDDVLKEFARRMQANVRGVDLACRLGGEEFVVVMPDTDVALAYSIAERLRQQIADRAFAAAQGAVELKITVSIGVAATLGIADDASALLERADQALYRAKREGRNRVVAEAA